RLPIMNLKGEARIENQAYHADFNFTEGRSEVLLKADYHPKEESYQVVLSIDSLYPTNFLPQDSLYFLTASVQMDGKGFDPFQSTTYVNIKGSVSDIHYGNYAVSDIQLNGSLKNHALTTRINSHYPLAKMALSLDATLHKEKINATLQARVDKLDLYGMHLMNDSLSTTFQLMAKAETDMKKNHLLDVNMSQWKLFAPNKTYHPKSLTLKADSDKDTTFISFQTGDLALSLIGKSDIETIMGQFSQVSDHLTQQFNQDSTINLAALRPYLPFINMKMSAQKENPIYNILQRKKLTFDQIEMDLSTSPEEGLTFHANLLNLMQDTTRIDTINIQAFQDSSGINYEAKVFKNKYLKQLPFSAQLQGKIGNKSIDSEFRYYNGKGETGILLGARIDKEKEGLRLHLFPENPILAFKPYRLNPDNYILYRNNKSISGDIHLMGEKNASLWIHSTEDENNEKEILAELSQIDLELLSQGFPDLPAMKGMFNADLRYVPSDSSFMVVADSYIDSLFYEGKRVGELMFNAVYLPINKKEHQVDIHLFRDWKEITALNAYYKTDKTDYLEGNLNITDLPLEMMNPFIPDNMAKLKGRLQGELSIIGTPTDPDINGFIQMDSSSIYVTAAGTTVHLDQQPIQVKDNFIDFNKYQILTHGDNPFIIDGTIDIHNPSKMIADLRLTAQEMELLNVKQNKESMVYGKLLVNLNSTVKGPLESLAMRGDLQLLGGTNVTYVMQESSLTTQDRLADLVTFTDFSDTLLTKYRRPEAPLPIGGLDMLMTIRIDPAVRINADITPDQSSQIKLEGGGDLSFQYTKQGDMILNGRYELTGGMVKYAIPIIPLKDFNIQKGSYVQWNGNPMNPTLNLTATERVRASVSQNDGNSRQVTFNVGIALNQTLENLDLKFILSAPEDQNMQQELNRMGEEQQSQIAVTMLMTGMYFNINDTGKGNKKSNLNMGAALNSFLQSEIN
ncbi:MAG: translocation/assembly module TamB domain-containing protein, partial [Parabacteroides sp.]|nr:translocation/assembly module TamB domain-containing protein [Parabacteroides sp.]